MAITEITYTGDGTKAGPWAVPFEYATQDTVHVFINGAETTSFAWTTPGTITLSSVLANQAKLLIKRETSVDEMTAEFSDGSTLTAENLNANGGQLFDAMQELENTVTSTVADQAAKISAIETTADTAEATSANALTTAQGAVSTANTALTKANAATTTANDAKTQATAAVSTANDAKTQATTAATNAAAAVSTANSASTTANAASATANSAATKATTATTDAASAVATANDAATKATTALSNSALALTSSDTAVATANNALLVAQAATGVGALNTDTVTNSSDASGTTLTDALNTLKSTKADTSAVTSSISTAVSNAVSGLTKSSVGLANVDNTSDANKPISSATQTALNTLTGTFSAYYPKTAFKNDGTGAAPVLYNFDGSMSIKGAANIFGPVETGRALTFFTGATAASAVTRWQWFVDWAPESGGSVGSNIGLARFGDTGSWIGTVLVFDRPTGIGTFEKTPYFPTALASDNSTQGATTAFVSTAVGSTSRDIAMLAMELADLKNSTVVAAGWWSESYDTMTTFAAGSSTNVDTSEAGCLKNIVSIGPNETPAMTSNGPLNGVTVSADAENVGGSGRYAWNAFDDNTSTIWAANTLSTSWLKVAFSVAKTIVNYDVIGFSGYVPTAWALEGSNDNTYWTAVDTRTGQALTAGVTTTYAVASPGSYLYYRIRITASTAGSGIWQEINLYSAGTKQNADLRFIPQDIGAVPATLDIYAAVQQVDPLTWGTDFMIYGTRNNAATWTQSGAITVIGTVGNTTIIKATVDASGQTSGQLVAPRFVTNNNKNFKILGHYIAGRN